MIRHLLPISSQWWGLASGKCQSDVHQRSIPQPSIKTLSPGDDSSANKFLSDILRKGCVCECFDLIMPRINSSRAAVFLYGRAFYVTYIQQEFYQSCNSPWYLRNFYMLNKCNKAIGKHHIWLTPPSCLKWTCAKKSYDFIRSFFMHVWLDPDKLRTKERDGLWSVASIDQDQLGLF